MERAHCPRWNLKRVKAVPNLLPIGIFAGRKTLTAFGLHPWTTCVEFATGGPLQQTRHFARQLNPLGRDIRIRTRVGSQQGRGIGMARVLENKLGQTLFHESAQVHDGHLLSDVSHDIQIVRDDHDAQT